MWNLKNTTNKNRLTDTEIGLVVAKGKRGKERDGLGVWGWYMQTIVYRMDTQQVPTV